MRTYLFHSLLALTTAAASAQTTAPTQYLDDLTPLEAPTGHYAELGRLATTGSAGDASDTLTYPPEEYRNATLLYALARPVYLSEQQADYLFAALRPPAITSAQTTAEIAYLHRLERERTPVQVARALELASIGYWPDAARLPTHPSYAKQQEHLMFMCRETLTPDCAADAYPATAQLLRGVMNDMRLLEFGVKYSVLRARPYALDTILRPLKTIGSPSFASGHTLWAYMQGLTLAELVPARRADLLALAREIGASRELMGVHYPSDEEAARQLAHRALRLMWHTRDFQRDLQAARDEWTSR